MLNRKSLARNGEKRSLVRLLAAAIARRRLGERSQADREPEEFREGRNYRSRAANRRRPSRGTRSAVRSRCTRLEWTRGARRRYARKNGKRARERGGGGDDDGGGGRTDSSPVAPGHGRHILLLKRHAEKTVCWLNKELMPR